MMVTYIVFGPPCIERNQKPKKKPGARIGAVFKFCKFSISNLWVSAPKHDGKYVVITAGIVRALCVHTISLIMIHDPIFDRILV